MQYKDLGDELEDERIRQIGEKVMKERLCAGIFVDAEGPTGLDKADRYIAKLTERFPGIRVIDKGIGPVPGTIFVRLAPPLQ